jgi:hypothetical protein
MGLARFSSGKNYKLCKRTGKNYKALAVQQAQHHQDFLKN